jgi:3-hydroxyisobutyrate dehydrogenase-like beta-hydroxyacid dehydrogenase
MTIRTVAILSPGEMGAAVGGALHANGFDVIACLEGRGAPTRERAAAAGFRDAGTIDAALAEVDIVLSILPPEFAAATAGTVAAAMKRTGRTPPYVDCNAVAPETAKKIGATIRDAGAVFIDGGIIGSPPGKGPKATRLFVSGPEAATMDAFDGKGLDIRQCGPEIGRASAIKMCYAGITKGTSALHAAVLIAAEGLGVGDELHEELEYSTGPLYKRMENLTPALPAVAARYIGEMREIAKTMGAVGVTTGFHDGATELYRLLEKSPFASERRDTVDPSRTMRQTVETCAGCLPVRDAAE